MRRLQVGNNKKILSVLIFSLIVGSSWAAEAESEPGGQLANLYRKFLQPPSSTRPGVYWFFMDGNQSRLEMQADLEAMASVGIGTVIMMEVDLGMPRGPIEFMSDEWQDNVAFAIKTAENLGLGVVMVTGPGWTGSGGPWVPAEDSMQHLTSSALELTGPATFHGQIDVPAPLQPNHFNGMSETLSRIRDEWYEDVAVLAFPTPDDSPPIDLVNLKTLKETEPYSIWKHVPRFISAPVDIDEPPATSVIDSREIVDLTDRMAPDGRLIWEVPDGEWTIMRFVSRSTGQTTRPAPASGHGFETDKFRAQPFLDHWAHFQGKLLKKAHAGRNSKGWTRIHLDSWEMSSQNWTQDFRQEFLTRRGYDPQPFYPAYAGHVIDSLETTERFLWDLRTTAQELVLENYAGVIRATAHKHGMQFSNQPYDMNPAGNIDLGSVADIPMCEFWDYRNSNLVDTLYSCIASTSIAHTMGRSTVSAEAFTSVLPIRFDTYPAQMKNQTDWALAFGINNLVFASFQHQPLGIDALPGMSMGPFGTNWHRHQNWWNMLTDYHLYIARASFLLQQGQHVADVLYMTPEGAPNIFLPPADALKGVGVLKDKRGFTFDAVTPRILRERASVVDGRVAFPNGTHYKLLVLPDWQTMTPETAAAVADLVKSGAKVIGNPPFQSPSLVGYPDADTQVKAIAAELWGRPELPDGVRSRIIGQGELFWGAGIYAERADDVPYPAYDVTASLLEKMGLCRDFTEPSGFIRFAHRRTDDADIYFVSNRTDQAVETKATFRVTEAVPEIWHPQTGERRSLSIFTASSGVVEVPLRFEAYESYFVVFSGDSAVLGDATENFVALESVTTIEGPWKVAFDADRGGPGSVDFVTLQDWREHANDGIKYYSGIATYSIGFDMPADFDRNDDYFIDLGVVYEMARVTLNGDRLGVAWTSPWRVPTGSALRDTDNKLIIEAANSWENRLIGDDLGTEKGKRVLQWPSGLLGGGVIEAGEHTFSTYVGDPSVGAFADTAKPELQPSGLIGPVMLLKVKK